MGLGGPFRAPGRCCLNGVFQHNKILKILFPKGFPSDIEAYPIDWWKLTNDGGGWDSVMHAYPFGLIFSDDPELASRLAADHSKLSHGSSIAISACAAMAAGTAYALQHGEPHSIVQRMYEVAQRYDDPISKRSTASLIQQVINWSKTPQSHEKIFGQLQGWSADEAIAAAAYIFAISHNDLNKAIKLGVHTPGDSDSIASLGGVLVGAYVGMSQIPSDWVNVIEDGAELIFLADNLKRII